ncbi:hypothetical protein J7M23_08345 [Candidatus Sumerlaeota bacterium]|nr:hypothetical protein [Candidatus Sumerlaeota bacterium]
MKRRRELIIFNPILILLVGILFFLQFPTPSPAPISAPPPESEKSKLEKGEPQVEEDLSGEEMGSISRYPTQEERKRIARDSAEKRRRRNIAARKHFNRRLTTQEIEKLKEKARPPMLKTKEGKVSQIHPTSSATSRISTTSLLTTIAFAIFVILLAFLYYFFLLHRGKTRIHFSK